MDFHYTVETDKSVEEAIAALEGHLKERSFGILWQLDLPAKLKEKGIDSYTEPYRILEVCNPREAAKVLGDNELAGYFLPCKIVVYRRDGMTKIGLPRPGALMRLLEDERLQETAESIEQVLVDVLNRSK
ncbi:DUF302 domain-containing protein [Cohnella mopanensis]|uniref:DUF302 domain-containing protein n=1 Tax=Cohnella mopanensis TaxID=2911966 RepID=UPI001EF7D4F7|nr:DUF302 domain-containing protein [Cohnella mopanensis]